MKRKFHPGPGQRLIPAPIVCALQDQLPQLIFGMIEGEDVFLLFADRPNEVVRYRASAEFMTAVRVAESGVENFRTLIGPNGFKINLLVPEEDNG
jgi:hypothetical protein